MSESIFTLAHAFANAGRFASLLQGVSVALPTGEVVKMRIGRHGRRAPLPGYRFAKHGYLTEITAGRYAEVGCGESDFKLLALQKSISEALERIVFRLLEDTPYGTPTSNGWATHLSRERAKDSADQELFERDAALVHWHSQEPFFEIDPETLPLWLKRWSGEELRFSEYGSLRILLSHRGHLPTVSTMLVNHAGHGVVSHATANNIEFALRRALIETCRIGQMAASRKFVEASRGLARPSALSVHAGPVEQGVFYAHHLTFPTWIFGETISWTQARERWHRHWVRFESNRPVTLFTEVLSAPLSVGFSTCPDVQPLYFGRLADGFHQGAINPARGAPRNSLPHFVA